MKKEQKKYIVIQTSTHNFGDGNVQTYKQEHYVTAVSEAQARSRVMHRLGYNRWNCVASWRGDGARVETFIVQEVVE